MHDFQNEVDSVLSQEMPKLKEQTTTSWLNAFRQILCNDMWSAPALGSEKEIIRIELIHALEVGLHNRCGALLMALIIDQTTNNIGKILSSTKPNYQQHWQDLLMAFIIDQSKPPTTLARTTLKSS